MRADPQEEYPRFNWLVPGKVAGAPHPDLYGGLPGVASFLRGVGVGSIISLYDQPLQPNPEELGFRYLFIETLNYQPPPDLPRLLDFMEAEVGKGRGVMVHCFAGIGRTGTALACWLFRQDRTLSAMEAVARVRERYVPEYARGRFPEHPSQFDAIEQCARAR